MPGSRQLNRFLRLTRPSALRVGSVGRCASTNARHNRSVADDDDGDFRPPWVYSSSRFLTYTAIPLTILYCAFLADWGEREHVFTPLRRWVSKYKQSVLSLSPEEVALVQGKGGQAPGTSSTPERPS